ncbi:MAG TPA: glucosidase [Candidatus Limnocylindria bacterium]|nr:glucosidase [Candidatus Limnocylindria bacterium]
MNDAESSRLAEDEARCRNWKRWGPYLAERQWGTVREDYSADGACWTYFPHDHARSRAYRWGEDGLLGITDRQCRLCFAVALWNGRDPILKERLFGLANPEGNHGEDVKECYFYLDATPTHSYLKALYKYPQREFPYAQLVAENGRRGTHDAEFELVDTGVFDGDGYFDVTAEYAKAGPDDILVRLTIANRGSEAAPIHVLPTLWFRNTWAWGRTGEGYWPKPCIVAGGAGELVAEHASLGRFTLAADGRPATLFTDNETNVERLFGVPNASPYVKDAFHEYVVHGRTTAVNPAATGTKAAFHYALEVPPHGEVVLRLRLAGAGEPGGPPAGRAADRVFTDRRREAGAFYDARMPATLEPAARAAMRQAYASLLWSKKFFHYVVTDWLDGDPAQPAPPASRRAARNHEWRHLYNRDVISMPDAWEYPWYAAWDLAFHMLPMARVDPAFAKEQLVLFTREWYMHPNGQLPAYEFALGDVNPPVHAWAAWRVYKMTAPRGARDRVFLSRIFQKMALNFTWWVNRKDTQGNNLFGGGFLGLDNIGVFDRSQPLPGGGMLEQADGTAWMAFYCITMLEMALELARDDPACEDMASKFFEHFVEIVDAINGFGGTGLWCPNDGFYYDQLYTQDHAVALRVRSMVGLLPLLACTVLEEETLARVPGFRKRLEWFLANRGDLARHVVASTARPGDRLLAIPPREHLVRTLRYMLDEREFLSPHGIRSLSMVHRDAPFRLRVDGREYEVHYTPAESDTYLFGGNSNWRGPVWFPVNYLLAEALERYHYFYGDSLRVECPTGSGNRMTLREVARELYGRLAGLFVPGADGCRPCHGADPRYRDDPHWRDLVTFAEYFCGDSGRGIGARYQGWTALAIRCFEDAAVRRMRRSAIVAQ